MRASRGSSLVVVIGLESCRLDERIAARREVVGLDHLLDQLAQRRAWRPAELLARLRRIAEQRLDLGGPVVTRVDAHDDVARLAPAADLALDRVDRDDARRLARALPVEREPHAE